MSKNIKVVGFDADDTLWVNENYFREAEQAFCEMLSDYLSEPELMKELYAIEMKNLELYGFGIKGFMLSLTETVLKVAGPKAKPAYFEKVLSLGKAMLSKPVELLDHVEEVIKTLQPKYRVILVTKVDLLDQQRKLEKSQLEQYFHHVEVMSNKHEEDYRKLVSHLDIEPSEFLMIGNSLRSDILPVVNIGGQAVYVPYEITWQHEVLEPGTDDEKNYKQVETLSDVLAFL